MTVLQIANKLHITERYVYNLLAKHREQEAHAVKEQFPDPITDTKKLSADLRKLLEPTADAFEAFFNRYSGLTLTPFAKDWVAHALDSRHLLLNVPPRHAKSKVLTVWYPLWNIVRNRDVQIVIVSQTVGMAHKFCREMEVHLSRPGGIVSDFGRFKPVEPVVWRPSQGEFLVEGRRREVLPGDLTVQARGAGTQILGMEADLIIVDDPVSREIARSEVEREKMGEWFHGDVYTRLSPAGRIVVVGQRLHPFDLYGEIAEQRYSYGSRKGQPLWDHILYPAILDHDKEEVLWPEVWPYERLMETYEAMKRKDGAYLFEAMYQQNPIPPELILLKREWIEGCTDPGREVGHGLAADNRRCRVLSIDPSPTEHAGAVIADLSADQAFGCTILEARSEKMDVRQMMAYLMRAYSQYHIDYCIIESNSAHFFLQDPTLQQFFISSGVKLLTHNTNKNKQDPILGVQSLAMDFEFGRIRIPAGNAESRALMQPFLDECLMYPLSPRDDQLMALWFIKFNFASLLPTKYWQSSGFHGVGPSRLSKGWQF